MKHYKIYLLPLMLCLIISSCKKFLDAKQNSKQSLITTTADCQLILNNPQFNSYFPSEGETSTDNYYVTDGDWASTDDLPSRNFYIWARDAQRIESNSQWLGPYQKIYSLNVVLEALEKINPNTDPEGYNLAKGSALFFRAYTLYELVSLYSKPFSITTADKDPGIPIRLSSDINAVSKRGTVKETYNQIITDFKQAIDLLTNTSIVATRPNKASAFAAIARVYLSMEDYENAGKFADNSLKLSHSLLDFNTLDINADYPFVQFNKEVVFHALMQDNEKLLYPEKVKVNPELYQSYADHDLRKIIYFRPNGGDYLGTYSFKNGYSANDYARFHGLATDEVYLIRAECYARAGNTAAALADLNTLLITRWDKRFHYQNITAYSADDALGKILTERRKELVFRGTSWTDLRRLNKDPRFARTLSRTIKGTVFTLPPNDPRYVLLIPQDVITNSTIEQNPR